MSPCMFGHAIPLVTRLVVAAAAVFLVAVVSSSSSLFHLRCVPKPVPTVAPHRISPFRADPAPPRLAFNTHTLKNNSLRER